MHRVRLYQNNAMIKCKQSARTAFDVPMPIWCERRRADTQPHIVRNGNWSKRHKCNYKFFNGMNQSLFLLRHILPLSRSLARSLALAVACFVSRSIAVCTRPMFKYVEDGVLCRVCSCMTPSTGSVYSCNRRNKSALARHRLHWIPNTPLYWARCSKHYVWLHGFHFAFSSFICCCCCCHCFTAVSLTYPLAVAHDFADWVARLTGSLPASHSWKK